MKRLRFISYAIMSFTLMALQQSCSSDNNASSDISGTPITFSISTTAENPNTAATRSATPPQEIILDPVKMTSNLDSAVYLHTIISVFPVEEQPTAATKGVLTTSIGSFGVSAYKYSSGTAADATQPYIDNEKATVSSSSASTSTTYYWPNNTTDKLAFYAYTPWSNSDVDIQTNRRQIKYTVNSTVTSQQDLLTASSLDNNIGTDASKTVNLTFNHALTAINFVVGSDMIPGTIKSISFENIITSGTYTIGGSWSGTTSSTFTYTPNKEIAGTNGEAITSGNNTLLMIPQEFTADNQKIKIVFNDGSADHTLYADLKATKWEEGKQITYKISSSAVTTLNIGTITFPTAWNSYSFPKTAYANSDEAGLFVVDNNNKVKNANVKLTYDGIKWATESSLTYSSNYKYFVYYPYHSTLDGATTVGNTNTSSSAADFFSSVVDNWSISETQTSETFKTEDLQYAMGSIDSSTRTVSFTMTHGMGLANIVLGSRQVPTTRTFSANSNTSYTDSQEKTTIFASNNFDGNTPASISSNYLALVKPNSATIFKSVTSDPKKWSSNLTYNIAANGYISQTASPSRAYAYMARKYTFTETIVSYTIPATGKYKLEVYGGQGGAAGTGTSYIAGGKGGKSVGYKDLTANTTLYIVAGGKGTDCPNIGVGISTGGYNGGGRSYAWNSTANGTGGGATHIATKTGLLSTLASDKSSVLIVAGGGGASASNNAGGTTLGGYGGGENGGTGAVSPNNDEDRGVGGSQTAGGGYIHNTSSFNATVPPSSGGFGYGGNGSTRGGAGGGAGYYGGGGASVWGGGGGGSGYVGNVTNGTTTGNINTGNGYAIITAQFMF